MPNASPAPCACGSALQLVTVKELSALLKIHPGSVWRQAALAEAGHGNFPRPLHLGPKTVRWKLGDVQAYLDGLSGGGQQ
jgi:predicted DNA-binding transcriptional regulator AlpA